MQATLKPQADTSCGVLKFAELTEESLALASLFSSPPSPTLSSKSLGPEPGSPLFLSPMTTAFSEYASPPEEQTPGATWGWDSATHTTHTNTGQCA